MKIYKITLPNHKMYIGQTTLNDIHIRTGANLGGYTSNMIFYTDIMIYGPENATIEILEDNIQTKELLNEREMFWIEYYQSWNHNIGYNISVGGKSTSNIRDPYYKSMEYKTKCIQYKDIFRRFRVEKSKITRQFQRQYQTIYATIYRGKQPSMSLEEHNIIKQDAYNKLRDIFINELKDLPIGS